MQAQPTAGLHQYEQLRLQRILTHLDGHVDALQGYHENHQVLRWLAAEQFDRKGVVILPLLVELARDDAYTCV